MLGPAGKHVLVSALPNDMLLRVVSAAQLADNGARSHLSKDPAMKVLIINDLGAGRSLVDRLWSVGAVHLACKNQVQSAHLGA